MMQMDPKVGQNHNNNSQNQYRVKTMTRIDDEMYNSYEKTK